MVVEQNKQNSFKEKIKRITAIKRRNTPAFPV